MVAGAAVSVGAVLGLAIAVAARLIISQTWPSQGRRPLQTTVQTVQPQQ